MERYFLNININTGRTPARLSFAAAAFLSFALIGAAYAAPHNGEEFLLSQPDGSLVRTLIWGDEFYQDVESPDGYTLVRDKDGWICYAELSADGSEYVSTGVRYTGGSRTAATAAMRKGLRISKKSIGEKHRRNRQILGYDELIAPRPAPPPLKKSASSDGASPAPRAEPKIVVGLTLLIDFPDQKSNIPQAAISDFCNRKGGVNGTNQAGSVYDYFYDVSNGLLEYKNIVTPFVTVDSSKAYYDRGTDYKYVPELLTSALNKLKAMNFDLSEVTTQTTGSGTNKREVVTALNVFYAGSATQGWANGIWPHSGTYRPPAGQSSVTINGVGFSRYQLLGLGTGGSPPGIGTFVHENGHLVMGWPDLYSYESPTHSNGVGNWCVMNSTNGTHPQQPNAYLRDLAGWIETNDITNWQRIRFSQEANSHKAYVYERGDGKEFYYIEARRRTSASVDPRNSAIPGSGLAIWHIHTQGDNTNNDKGFPRIALVQADGRNDLERKANSGDATDLYRWRVNNSFDRTTTPAAVYYDGVRSDINITEISDSGAMMTFHVGDAWNSGSPKWYLNVVNGSYSGYYEAGAQVAIFAPDENPRGSGYYFLRWTKDEAQPLRPLDSDPPGSALICLYPPCVEDVYANPTNVTTAAAEATITAQFVKIFSLPGQIEADSGYLQGIVSVSNTANGATGNRVARLNDTSRFAEYNVSFACGDRVGEDEDGLAAKAAYCNMDSEIYKLSYRLLTSSSSAGKFILKDVTNDVVLDTVIVPTSTRTTMQTVNGREVLIPKIREGRSGTVWRLERESGSYSIDWIAVEKVGATAVVHNRESAPLAYGLRAARSGSVSFQIPSASHVSVRVYDMRGRMVAVLCDGVRNPGVYNMNVSPRGAGLSRGLYVVRMKSGGYSRSVRLNYSR